MPDFYLLRNDEFAVQEEAAYGTSPGALAGGDFFKHTSPSVAVVPELEELYRDRDRDNAQASVLELQTGRKRSQVALEMDLIPSGVTGTPTPPDPSAFWKALLGSEHTADAHTTTTSGSAGTALELATGGVAASGIEVGDLIAVDVSAAVGIEVREVAALPGADTVTLDRALTADPATGRDVFVGSTYSLDEATALSLFLWLFNNDDIRETVPGLVVKEGGFEVNFGEAVPLAKCRFGGTGKYETAQTATTRPTPTTQGSPLTPAVGKVWIGATSVPIISANVTIANGLTTRETESDSLEPTGAKRTENSSRYMVEQTLEMYLRDDTKTFYDGSKTRTARDVICQLGDSVGNIFAWRTRNWKPRGERMEQDGEIGLRLAGRALGVSGDDEIKVAFL
jgi:hypothetical protein